MADTKEKVTIEIDVTGADRAANEIGKANQALTGNKAGTAPTAEPSGGLGGAAKATTARMTGLASTSSALGSVISQVSPQMGAFAQIVGTAGASISGLTTAIGGGVGLVGGGLLAAMGLLAVAVKQQRQEMKEARDEAARLTAAYREQERQATSLQSILSRLQSAEAESALLQRIGAGRGTRQEQEAAAIQKSEEIAQTVRRLREISGDPTKSAERRELQQRQRELEAERRELGRFTVEARRREQLERDRAEFDRQLAAAGGLPERRGGGGGRAAAAAPPAPPDFAAESEETRRLGEGILGDIEKRQQAEADAAAKLAEEQKKIAFDVEMERARILERGMKEREAMERQSAETMRDVWMGASGAIFATSVQQIADLAKGHKFQAGAFIESIGDQLVASGTQHVLQAAAMSFIPGMNFMAPGLAAAGAAEIAAGTAMGAVGARGAGGTASGGGRAAGLGSARTGSAASPSFLDRGARGGDTGPSTVIVNLSSTVAPSDRDGERVLEALGKARRRGGSAAFINAGIQTR